MHTEGHDPGRPEGTAPQPPTIRDSEHPGYETQDVSVRGIVTFLAGLSGFVIIFFFFCFIMGKVINYEIAKSDGPTDKWHSNLNEVGSTPRGAKREDLASDADMEQRQLGAMTQAFPTPRLEMDDGNQDLADLHAREDLLLNFYSTSPDLPAGTVRIPIDRAMQLVLERGLPTAPQPSAQTLMAGETAPSVAVPLTNGFARTGYELGTIEAREQKNEFNRAEGKQ
jgi:hypothetical protein